MGLVNRIVDSAGLVDAAIKMAEEIIAAPPAAIAAAKRSLGRVPPGDWQAIHALLAQLDPAEWREGLTAFAEKRTADFERLTQYLAPWDQERRTLAAGITPREFHLIAVAFRNLEEYVVDPTGIDAVLETVTRAREIAWRASGMKKKRHARHRYGTRLA